MNALIAQKLGMTHMYDSENRHIPVTILKALPQVITEIKTEPRDGYEAVQIGVVGKKSAARPQSRELMKRSINLSIAYRQEVRFDHPDDTAMPKIGTTLSADTFTPGDEITVTGRSKGKGFAGTIKRHGFHRGPSTHGSKNVRKPGSIGSGYPQRVVPGVRMAGHMGAQTVTTQGIKIIAVNTTDNTLAVAGVVPGPNKSLLLIKKV